MKKPSTFAVIVLAVLFLAGCGRSSTSHPGDSQPTNENQVGVGNSVTNVAGNSSAGTANSLDGGPADGSGNQTAGNSAGNSTGNDVGSGRT